MGFLAILNAGIACTRVVLIVGANVLTTSGKETGITNTKKESRLMLLAESDFSLA